MSAKNRLWIVAAAVAALTLSGCGRPTASYQYMREAAYTKHHQVGGAHEARGFFAGHKQATSNVQIRVDSEPK